MGSRFREAAWRSSERCRPHDEEKPEVSDFTCVGHVGPVLQGFGAELRFQKLKGMPPQGHHESPDVCFNCLVERRIHEHIYLACLNESGVVDYLVVIDSRRWPSLIYDSCYPYPLMLSSTSFFQCRRPDAEKVKIMQLYAVIRNRRSGERPRNLKRRRLSMPCAVKSRNIVTVKSRLILISWMHHVPLFIDR